MYNSKAKRHERENSKKFANTYVQFCFHLFYSEVSHLFSNFALGLCRIMQDDLMNLSKNLFLSKAWRFSFWKYLTIHVYIFQLIFIEHGMHFMLKRIIYSLCDVKFLFSENLLSKQFINICLGWRSKWKFQGIWKRYIMKWIIFMYVQNNNNSNKKKKRKTWWYHRCWKEIVLMNRTSASVGYFFIFKFTTYLINMYVHCWSWNVFLSAFYFSFFEKNEKDSFITFFVIHSKRLNILIISQDLFLRILIPRKCLYMYV